MFGALIGEATGVPVQVIQYRGSSQAMTDLAGGRIDMAFPTYGLGAPFIAEKKVKPIAVAADKRWSQFPDLPTLVEAGLVKHMVAMWFGLLAPAGTPAPIVAKLNEAVAKASRDPDLVARMTATGTSIRVSAPDEMRTLMASESTNVESMIQRLEPSRAIIRAASASAAGAAPPAACPARPCRSRAAAPRSTPAGARPRRRASAR